MRAVFADSSYWIAAVNRADQWHDTAIEAFEALGDSQLVTTDSVLAELLTALSAFSVRLRDNNIQVIPQTRTLFLEGLRLYEERSDKNYSLQDCISMVVMKNKSIMKVLTSDHHFEQEGLIILMKSL